LRRRACCAQHANDALKELFTTILLPDRKLLFFEQQALSLLPEGKEGSRRLLYYYMEDAVKKR
jgi:ribosome biogenesis protein MAK21